MQQGIIIVQQQKHNKTTSDLALLNIENKICFVSILLMPVWMNGFIRGQR